MKLSAPGKPLFVISLVLFILAVLAGPAGMIAALGGYVMWIALASWVVLAVGCLMTGM